MKALLLTTSYPAHENHIQSPFVHTLAKHLAKNIDTHVICPFYQTSKSKEEVIDNVKIHRFQYIYPLRYQTLTEKGGIASNIKKSFWMKLQMFKLLSAMFFKSLKHIKDSDVIHAQWTPSALVGIFLKKLYKKPLVLTTRGADVKANKFLLNYIIKNCDYITPNNIHHAELFKNLNKNIKTVPNGVDTEIFKPRNIKKKPKTVLFIGWLIKRKGVDILLEAFQNIKANLVICGSGDMEEELKSLAKELNIDHKVSFIGDKPSNEIPFLYNAADVVVLPSLSEGRPNVILEATVSGATVIATNIPGTNELIVHDKTGLLVPTNNPEELASAINELLKNKRKAKKLAKAARKDLLKKGYSWDSTAEEYIKIYNSVVKT